MTQNERNTYLSTQEYVQDISKEMEKEFLFQEPLTKSILAYLYLNPIVASEPEMFKAVYQKIADVLIKNLDQAHQMVLTALNPVKIQGATTKDACVSSIILKNCPSLILSLLSRGSEAIVLFQFLNDLQNQTALGYLRSIFDQDSQFQNLVLKFFAGSAGILEVCFQNCHYQDVFLILTNAITQSNGELTDFKMDLVQRIMSNMIMTNKPDGLFQNIMGMMGMVLQNVLFMAQELLQVFFRSLSSDNIDVLTTVILEHYTTRKDMVEYQLRTLSYIVAIYKTIKHKKLPIDTENLQKVVVAIIRNFGSLMSILLLQSDDTILFQNGETVPQIGLVRYYLFVLFRDILSLDSELVSKHLQLTVDKLRVIEVYLCKNRWSNIMHKVVEECAILILKHERTNKEAEKYTRRKEFLNFLIKEFKSSQYMFLGTNNLSSYGNIYYLYNIARAVAVQLQDTAQLQDVMRNNKPLHNFITADLHKFQVTMDSALSDNSSYMVKSKPDSIKKLVRKMSVKEIGVVQMSKKMAMEDEVVNFIKTKKTMEGTKK